MKSSPRSDLPDPLRWFSDSRRRPRADCRTLEVPTSGPLGAIELLARMRLPTSAGATTGVEVADVMAHAQAHGGGHERLPQLADRGPVPDSGGAAARLAGIIRTNECVRERPLHGGKVTQPTDTRRDAAGSPVLCQRI